MWMGDGCRWVMGELRAPTIKGKPSWFSYILSKTWWMVEPSTSSSSEESRRSSSLARN